MSTTKRLVLSLRGRKESQSTTGTSSTRLVSTNSFSPGHDLGQVSAVSGSEYSSQILLNGPYDSSNSRPHLTDLSSKFDASRAQLGPSASHQGIFISHESLNVLSATNTANPSISTTTSDIDLAKKCRKISLQSKSSAKPLLISWDRRKRSHGGLAGNAEISKSLNPTSKNAGMERLQFEEKSGTVESSNREHPQNVNKVTFIFDPAGRLCYYWSMIVSLAFLYNFWVIIYRFAFQEININSIIVWFCLDYFADFLYLIDILFHFRTGYLEDGVLQTDSKKLRHHYMNSTTFYIDCLCLLPLDFLYLSVGFNSILRSFRLVKMYRFWAFMDRTERHTNYPNLFRSTSLIHYLLVIFHWNGCLYHIIHKNNGFGSRNWVYHDSETADVVKQYLQSFYWCTLALTTIGDLPKPRSIGEYVFVIMQLLFGLMLFATVLGHVANIVTSVSSARKEFQAKLDDVKTYMRLRRVPNHLQVKVIKWFDYLWLTQKCSNEERAVSCLPDKLKAEIAINVHLDTLKRVEIFQNTEAGFLCELVLKLRPVLFSPGDYICRKGEHYHPHCQRYLICILGEVGKEMYIVNRGRLQVVADNGKTVMASLKAGSYFGEISILNMGTEGNRRTASVLSVGYSDLFVLSKKDMWDVLKEYPAARVRLESIAVRRLEKYKRSPFQSVLLDRCQSTPGLVESLGRTTLEDMWLPSSSPLVGEKQIHSEVVNKRSVCNTADYSKCGTSTCSNSPSVHSSDDHPRSRTASIHSKCISRIIPNDELNAYLNSGDIALNPPAEVQQVLEDEINRLRARLHSVESENQVLTSKLSQQQWNLETRLAELEMQMQRRSSTSSIDHEIYPEDIERNRESII